MSLEDVEVNQYKPVGESKEKLMQVCNKESSHRNKISNSSMVSFI